MKFFYRQPYLVVGIYIGGFVLEFLLTLVLWVGLYVHSWVVILISVFLLVIKGKTEIRLEGVYEGKVQKEAENKPDTKGLSLFHRKDKSKDRIGFRLPENKVGSGRKAGGTPEQDDVEE